VYLVHARARIRRVDRDLSSLPRAKESHIFLRINLGGVAANARFWVVDRDHGSDLHCLHLIHQFHYRLGIFLTSSASNTSNSKDSPLQI
jgi:hypothetical protein